MHFHHKFILSQTKITLKQLLYLYIGLTSFLVIINYCKIYKKNNLQVGLTACFLTALIIGFVNSWGDHTNCHSTLSVADIRRSIARQVCLGLLYTERRGLLRKWQLNPRVCDKHSCSCLLRKRKDIIRFFL